MVSLTGISMSSLVSPVGCFQRSFTFISSVIKTGVNVLAIEGYNDDLDSSDFTLDPSLYLNPVEVKEPPKD